MQVENWSIDKVEPYDNNPRDNDDAVEAVANSIREFGFQQPIVVDGYGTVIVGHTRLKAAQSLGLSEVPVVVADNLTPNQVQAYRLADNKTGELASWDWDKLSKELEDIDWLDIDMSEFGFTELENRIRWDDVEDLSDETYDEPEHVMLRCPKCNHVDRKEHFIAQ